ncbi:MAG: hypothetical protein WCP73_02290 [Eubacteriales bacterium]
MEKNKNFTISKFVWIPRIAAIVFILFLMLFSLETKADGLWDRVYAFLIHSMPSILIAVFLAFCWNRPKICGWVFFAIAVFFTIWFNTYMRIDIFLLISVPPIVIGVLFLIASRLSGKTKSA